MLSKKRACHINEKMRNNPTLNTPLQEEVGYYTEAVSPFHMVRQQLLIFSYLVVPPKFIQPTFVLAPAIIKLWLLILGIIHHITEQFAILWVFWKRWSTHTESVHCSHWFSKLSYLAYDRNLSLTFVSEWTECGITRVTCNHRVRSMPILRHTWHHCKWNIYS